MPVAKRKKKSVKKRKYIRKAVVSRKKYIKKKPHKRTRHKISRKKVKRKRRSNVLGGADCISQKQPYDCVVACLAMFIDKNYNYVKNKYFSDHDFSCEGQGITKYNEIKVLEKEGYIVRDISPILPVRKAIVTVPSLNYKGKYHAVFWDGITICDPNANNKKKNSKIKIYSHTQFLNEPYKQPIISEVQLINN